MGCDESIFCRGAEVGGRGSDDRHLCSPASSFGGLESPHLTVSTCRASAAAARHHMVHLIIVSLPIWLLPSDSTTQ